MTVGARVRYRSIGSGTYDAVIEAIRSEGLVDLVVMGLSLTRIPRDDDGRRGGSWMPA